MNQRKALIDAGEILFSTAAGSEVRKWYIYPREGTVEDWIRAFRLADDAKKWMAMYGGEQLNIHSWEDYSMELVITPLTGKAARNNLDIAINKIKASTRSDDVLICFGASNGTNFRNQVATIRPYKDGRKEKPYHYRMLESYIKDKYAYIADDEGYGYEDDDMLAMVTGEAIEAGIETVLCSSDKDLNQIPGLHYNLNKKEMYEVSEIEALRSFYKQLYTGDPTDTIPGIYQITGERINKGFLAYLDMLDNEDELYEEVLFRYANALQTRDVEDLECILWEIANLLYMRRSVEDEGWTSPLNR